MERTWFAVSTSDGFLIMTLRGDSEWKPKAGGTVKWRDMDCGWLRNVIAFLDRAKDRRLGEAMECYGYSGGDMAEMYAGHAADDAMNRAETIAGYQRRMKEYLELRERYGYISHGS